MNPIYKGQLPPRNPDVIWIYGKEVRIFQNGGWVAVNESTIVDQVFNPESTHAQSGAAIAGMIGNADANLSTESENLIKNNAVYKQYMDKKDIDDIILQIDPDYYKKQYLTFEILSSGVINWGADNTSTFQYSKNGGEWTSLAPNGTISVVNNDKVRFKGTGNPIPGYINPTQIFGFRGTTCSYNVYGNIMSLLGGDSFQNITTFPANNWFHQLFMSTSVIDASNLILPATTLTESCYSNMFNGCTSLIAAPELPATSLGQDCYQAMFYGCTSLTTAPELLATENFANHCYRWMFTNCANLNYIKCLAPGYIVFDEGTMTVLELTSEWVQGVVASGTFVKAENATWSTGINEIPSGWTVENA